jgi:DNA-directed RNA polymerase specialized sigma24 family protein
MRRYLIDHARARPDGEFVALDGMRDLIPASGAKLDLALTVDKLLDELMTIEPTWCSLVEMKFFFGLTDEEAAEALGISLRSMQRMWRDARQWLFERVGKPDGTE